MIRSLLVGCPLRSRDWIIRKWLLCVEQSCEQAGIIPKYVFALPGEDAARAIIEKACDDRDRKFTFVSTGERQGDNERSWTAARVRDMVLVRNALLKEVRKQAPDAFLSVDSDILLAEEAVESLLGCIKAFDAVGGKTYMSEEGITSPSYANFVNANGLSRTDHDGVMPVDCIMGIKLLLPVAYAVDYCWNHDGEDIGWSRAAAAAGVRLGWDGRVISKHCMNRDMVDQVDWRCGY